MAEQGWKMDSTWLRGRTVLVTGATSGIGRATLDALAPVVQRLLFVGRDADLVRTTASSLTTAFPQLEVHGFTADLALQAETRKVAAWATAFPELHGLVNNVGAVFDQCVLTADGIERQFAINYVNQALLTRALLPLLLRSANPAAPSRIVMVSSMSHRKAKPLSTEFSGLKPYIALLAYRQSKLAQCLFTVELARRLQGQPLTINALCPGPTRTRIGSKNTHNWLVRSIWSLSSRFFRPVEEGAAHVLKVLADDALNGATGQFYENFKLAPFGTKVLEAESASSLWNETCDRLNLPREL